MDYSAESLKKHYEWKGKLEIIPKVPLNDKHDLSLAYTPGVSSACMEINKDVSKSYQLTGRGNTVAVITDGTAVLGLGDIGPEAAMPVMEGKCALFKAFGGIDAVPLCIRSKDPDTIVDTISLLAGNFAGINLEDISAPRCFYIEERLKKCCDIPIFHDDQHGTAIVTLAALINALKLTGRKLNEVSIAINGAGAAGIAITKLLMAAGLKDAILCDKNGAIFKGRQGLNEEKEKIAFVSNKDEKKGPLKEIIKGADVFIGVSAPNVLTKDMVKTMKNEPIVFSMANPTPEIMPEDARDAGAAVIGTGRSDFPNQINNVLAFPGVFRGALNVRATDINDSMNIAAAFAIAGLIAQKELCADYIIPPPFDSRIADTVAKAVSDAAVKTGVASESV